MKIAPLLILPLIVAHAYAFDVWGFRSGISEAQASAVGQREGYAVHESGVPGTARFHSLVFQGRYADGVPGITYIASFCDGHLTWISHDYTANIGTLFELLNDLKSTYGTAKVETSSNMLTDGRARSIDFQFPRKPDDITTVAVNLTMNTDSAFGIQVIHHNTEMRCP